MVEYLQRYGMTAGWFIRDPVPPEVAYPELCPDRLPWVLYSPEMSTEPVPMIIYFGGTGEHGLDLIRQFNQRGIFEKVCTPDFQEKHPCYLFAPMLPGGRLTQHIWNAKMGEPVMAFINDTIYAMIGSLQTPPVDTNRLYVTGLSYGGAVACSLLYCYPGRFAAAMPTSYSLPESTIALSIRHPGLYWLFANEDDYIGRGWDKKLPQTAELIESRGGELRISVFPASGHDAWNATWKEDVAWEWLFSKDLRRPAGIPASARPPTPSCTASVPGRDAKTGPQFGGDGLDGTSYVSQRPMTKGDWWQAEYPRPVAGQFSVETGARDGAGALSNGRVEVSADGATWAPAGDFERGACRFEQRTPIRFLRVLPEPDFPEVLTLRKVKMTL